MQDQCSFHLDEAIMKSIGTYNLSRKRTIFALIGDADSTSFSTDDLADVFIPTLGITFGEFCVHYTCHS